MYKVMASFSAAIMLASLASLSGCPQLVPVPANTRAITLITTGDGSKQGGGSVNLSEIERLELTITDISLDYAGNSTGDSPDSDFDGSKVTVFSGARKVNLLDLIGVSEILSEMEVPAGPYTQIRMSIADPRLYLASDPETAITDVELTTSNRIFVSKSFELLEGRDNLIVLNLGGIALQDVEDGGFALTPQLDTESANTNTAATLRGAISAVDTESDQMTVGLEEGSIDIAYSEGTTIALPSDPPDAPSGTEMNLVVGQTVSIMGTLMLDGSLAADAIRILDNDEGEGDGGGGDGGDDDMTAEERMAIMDEAGAYFDSLDSTSLGIETKAGQMKAWLDDHEAFVQTGVSDDDMVWAFFEDGYPVAFVDNYLVGDGALPPVTPPRKVAPAGAGPAAGPPMFHQPSNAKLELDTRELFTNELPRSNKSEVLAALGKGFAVDGVATELTARLADTGYVPGSLTHASPPTIKQISEMDEVGVLLLIGHAGEIRLDRDIPGNFLDLGEGFLVQTPAPVALADFADVLPEVKAGRVVPLYSSVTVDENVGLINEWRWAITHEFIETYIEFADEAVVGVYGCNSYNEHFVRACFNKGAGAYFGFDQYIFDDWAATTFRHFVNRTLGSVVTAAWDSQPVRPFDFWPTLSEMERRGIRSDTNTDNLPDDLPPDWESGATLRVEKAENARVSLLAPSIRVLRLSAADAILEVHGLFGDQPEDLGSGSYVSIDGVQLPIVSWERWRIRCTIPSSGAGSKGDVFVSVRGMLSNVVTLSEYDSSAEFAMGTDDHGTFATAQADFRFRMPLEPFRIMPDSDPIFMLDEDILDSDLEELQNLLLRYMELAEPITGVWEADSTLTYAYAGLYQENNCGRPGPVSGEGTLNTHVFDWNDPTGLPYTQPFAMGVCLFFPDPDTGEMTMTIRTATNLATGTHNSACEGNQEVVLVDSALADGEIAGELAGYDLLEGSHTGQRSGRWTTVTWEDILADPVPMR